MEKKINPVCIVFDKLKIYQNLMFLFKFFILLVKHLCTTFLKLFKIKKILNNIACFSNTIL